MFSVGVSYPAPSPSSPAPRRLWLYFGSGPDDNDTLVVDGLGTAAQVEEPDVGATNGVLHVIDRVLGFPAQTVGEKVAMDPMMRAAHSLGEQVKGNPFKIYS